MIEVLKEFLLFGVVEVFILLMFYKYVGKIDKVKYWHGLILCPLFFIVGLIQFPYAKQIGMIVIMIAYLYLISKKLNIKVVVLSSLYLLVVEMIFCILLDFSIGFNFTELNTMNKFFVMIPIRLIELLLIFIYKRRHKDGLDVDVRN
jgi:hypothetical protein